MFGLLADGAARRELADDVSRTRGAQAIATLLSAGVLQDRHAAVFVPPENGAFWTTYEDCRGDPFFVPAVLGVPMLRGLNPPAPKCPGLFIYALGAYAADAASEPTSDADLCARGTSYGFDAVYILAAPALSRKIECATTDSPRR
jgi:hypothetical protein